MSVFDDTNVNWEELTTLGFFGIDPIMAAVPNATGGGNSPQVVPNTTPASSVCDDSEFGLDMPLLEFAEDFKCGGDPCDDAVFGAKAAPGGDVTTKHWWCDELLDMPIIELNRFIKNNGLASEKSAIKRERRKKQARRHQYDAYRRKATRHATVAEKNAVLAAEVARLRALCASNGIQC